MITCRILLQTTNRQQETRTQLHILSEPEPFQKHLTSDLLQTISNSLLQKAQRLLLKVQDKKVMKRSI